MPMLRLIFIAALMSGTSAKADVHAVFGGTGETRLLINGMPGNMDGVRFFEMMTAPFTVADNKQIKNEVLADSSGQPALSITCSNSMKMKNFAHCELVFPPSAHSKPDSAHKFFQFFIKGRDVDTFLAAIALPNMANPVYISSDGHMTIFVNRPEAGVSLDLQYQE